MLREKLELLGNQTGADLAAAAHQTHTLRTIIHSDLSHDIISVAGVLLTKTFSTPVHAKHVSLLLSVYLL